MNRVFLSGRIVKKPVVEVTPTGKKVVEFTIAVYRTKDVSDFIRLQAWEKTAETIELYTDKGSKINVEAHLYSRKYENKENKTIYVTDIIVDRLELMSAKDKPAEEEHQEQAQYLETETSSNNPDSVNLADLADITKDDLPF